MTRRKIAVIGSGVSGMTAGYFLSHFDYVTLFEADGRLGGHADTHLVVPPAGPPIGVDTGFIVYNERTYPLLTKMFAELGVTTQAAEMSMSVRCAGCGLQYAGQRGLGGLTPGIRRGRGRYLRMLAEVPRFHRAARRLLATQAAGPGPTQAAGLQRDQTLGEFLDQGGFSGYFTAHFALPLVAAVWSCPPGTALRYPARYLFAFLANHGMLAITGSPLWRTVTGGSRGYVERAAKRLHDIRLSTPVRAVRRHREGAEVRDAAGETHQFDAVLFLDETMTYSSAPRPGPTAPRSRCRPAGRRSPRRSGARSTGCWTGPGWGRAAGCSRSAPAGASWPSGPRAGAPGCALSRSRGSSRRWPPAGWPRPGWPARSAWNCATTATSTASSTRSARSRCSRRSASVTGTPTSPPWMHAWRRAGGSGCRPSPCRTTRGSGKGLTERRMADRPQYADYVARTSGFIPLPPKRPAPDRGIP